MADELTVNNGNTGLTTAQIADYIHNAAELEKDIYTLERTENEFKEKIKELKWSEDEISKPIIKEIPDVPKMEKMSVAEYICYWIGGLIGGLIGSILPLLILQAIKTEYGLSWTCFWIIAAIIIVIFTVLSSFGVAENEKDTQAKRQEEARQRAIDERENTIRFNESSVKEYEDKIEQCRRAREKSNVIKKQMDILRQRRVELEAIRSQLYSVGIIPPDYRTMDCVYGLDHIFRNGLADTMREAVLQYEDRVFKGQVVRGMGAILSQLRSLSGQMSYIVNDIHTINRNVEFMSQDLSNLADSQARGQKTLDSILEESKATRYANEAIQKHNEEVKKYMDDTRRRFNY